MRVSNAGGSNPLWATKQDVTLTLDVLLGICSACEEQCKSPSNGVQMSYADVAQLVDALDLGSSFFGYVGSNPIVGTTSIPSFHRGANRGY